MLSFFKHSKPTEPKSRNFYSIALSAAKLGIEAFRATFEEKDADANAREHGAFGNYLIITLINTIPDAQLPLFLDCLIKNKGNIEVESLELDQRPLALAAFLGKEKTVEFLIASNAVIQGEKIRCPALCSAAGSSWVENLSSTCQYA